MKRLTYLFVLFSIIQQSNAQLNTYPNIFYFPYETETSALTNASSKNEWVMPINTNWHFFKTKSINDISQDFFKKEFNDSNWESIYLPTQPINTENNIIFYRKFFLIPEIYYGRQIFLYLKDTSDLFSIWLNSKQVIKINKNSRQIIDITPFVKFGSINLINIIYKNEKASTNGLISDISIYTLPPVYFKNYELERKKSTQKSIEIKAHVYIVNSHLEENTKVDLGIGIYTVEGKKLYFNSKIKSFSMKNNSETEIIYSAVYKNDTIFEQNKGLKILLLLKDKAGNQLAIPCDLK